MDELNNSQATPIEQGDGYADLVTESLNEFATEGKVQAKSTPTEAKQKASPEDILRSMSKTQAKSKEEVQLKDGVIEEEATEEVEESEELEASEGETESEESDEELLDLIYKGQVEPTPKSEVVKLAQMGKDYTLKTQALAAEKQKFQSEVATKTQEIEALKQEVLTQKQAQASELESFSKFKFAFEIMKDANPDLYEEVDKAIASVMNQYDNPVIRRQTEALSLKQKMLEEQLSQLSGEGIKQKYFSEEAAVKKEFEDSLRELGVIVDWQKVKETYANGNGTVKEALFSTYGDEITSASTSKAKLASVRKQAARVGTKIPLKGATKGVQAPKNYSKMSYNEIYNDALKELGIG